MTKMARRVKLLILTDQLKLGNAIGLLWMNYLVTKEEGFFRYGTDSEYFQKLALLLKGVNIDETTYICYAMTTLNAVFELYVIRVSLSRLSFHIINYVNRFNSFAIVVSPEMSKDLLAHILRLIIRAKTTRLFIYQSKVKDPVALVMLAEKNELNNLIEAFSGRFKNYAIFDYSNARLDINNESFSINIDEREKIKKLFEPLRWIIRKRIKVLF